MGRGKYGQGGRELWALADPELSGYVGSAGTVRETWPHLEQVCRLERPRTVKGKKQVEVSYAISSLPATRWRPQYPRRRLPDPPAPSAPRHIPILECTPRRAGAG